MSENVRITINGKEEFTGRLVGLIDKFECRAVMNTKDAASRIFTAQSISIGTISGIIKNKRFVIATSNYSTDLSREIFISPAIRYLSFKHGEKTFKCEDENEYTLKEL